MSNQEREGFVEWSKSIGLSPGRVTVGEYHAFQAGAAYQREQVKGLVEALESIAMCADGYSGAECSRIARSALKPYRAAQEGK